MNKFNRYNTTEKLLVVAVVVIVSLILFPLFALLNQLVIAFVFNYQLSFIQSLVFTIWLSLYLSGSRGSK